MRGNVGWGEANRRGELWKGAYADVFWTGRARGQDGHSADTCPYTGKAWRRAWLEGWECGRPPVKGADARTGQPPGHALQRIDDDSDATP